MKTRFIAILCLILSLAIGVTHGLAAGALCATLTGAALMPRNEHALYAVGPFTLLDIALRSGKGVHALIEGVTTYAPELMTFSAIPKAGLTYSTLTCTALPNGDFAKVGAGVSLTKSDWKRDVGQMAKFADAMRINEDVLLAARAENADLVDGDILASEAIRHMRGNAIRIGAQTWYGAKISGDGFAGLSTQVATATNEVNAGGGAGADSSSVYLVYMDADPVNPEGVHYVIGNGGKMQFSDTWLKQQITDPNDATKFMDAYTNGFLAFLGLVVPRNEAVYRVKNVTAANPFTDSVGAQLLQKVPLALRQDKSKWRWFMNSACSFYLQNSRQTTISSDAGIKGTGAFPAEPTSCQGIAIQLTDSLLTTERAGIKP